MARTSQDVEKGSSFHFVETCPCGSSLVLDSAGEPDYHGTKLTILKDMARSWRSTHHHDMTGKEPLT